MYGLSDSIPVADFYEMYGDAAATATANIFWCQAGMTSLVSDSFPTTAPDDQRPDPDVLLQQMQQEEARAQRGRLKIFFGASAGVGKTYAMLSAAHTAHAQGVPLIAGADDYLVKLFGAGELLARVRAQLRRQGTRVSAGGGSLIVFGNISIDLVKRTVNRAGETRYLTPIEYRLLTHLVSHPECVLTHKQLLHAAWGPGHTEHTHYVRVHMANLRKKIEADPSRPCYLLTEAGVGYRFCRLSKYPQ